MNTGKPCVELMTQYGVPLLINDRIDVHLAVGAWSSPDCVGLAFAKKSRYT